MNFSNITLEVEKNIATITFDRPKQLNALALEDYQLLAKLMRQVAVNDAVTMTILTGTGKYFSAGADVNANRGSSPADPKDEKTRQYWLSRCKHSPGSFLAAGNIDVTKTFISHPKILIAALNGPVIGLSAALVAHCDFIYASQSAFLLTPFSSLGLVAEGGSSYTFVKRMGLSTANAALITSSRIPASQLLACGFVNKIFPTEGFAGAVQAHIAATFGSHLNADSMLRIKGLVRASYVRELEAVNVLEHFGGLERFAEGVPQAQFMLMASGQKKHKL